MSEQLGKLREAIRSSKNIEEVRINVKPLARELGLKYEEFDFLRLRHERQREDTEREYKVSLPESAIHFRISFAEPVPAREFCDAMGWKRIFALSKDVHQMLWHIEAPESEMEDRRYLRSYRSLFDKSEKLWYPRLGEWSIHARLKGRPQGEYAADFFGPSPAYDLRVCPEHVTNIDAYPIFLFL